MTMPGNLEPASRGRCCTARPCAASGQRCGLKRAGFGPVPETIADVARQAKADQIVMGTHGHGRLGTAVLGSVANGVIHLVHVPVTLIKAGGRHWDHRQGSGWPE